MAEQTIDPTELFASAIDILQRDFTIPTNAGVNTSKAKGELSTAAKTRDEASRTIDESKTLTASATAAEKNAISRLGQATAEGILADQARVQKLADDFALANRMFGISPDEFSGEIATLAKSAVPMQDAARKKLTEVRTMQSVGPLDDPLEWLYNQIQLPSKIQDYNRSADEVNSIYDTIERATKVSQDLASQWNRATPAVTATMAKSKADAALAKSAQEVAAADQNMAKVNVEYATRKLAGDLSIAQQTAQMTQLDLANNNAIYQSKIQAITLADTHAQRLLKAGELLNTVGQTKALDKLLEQYDMNIGNKPGTTTRYIFSRLNDDQQKNMVSIGAGSAGTNPYEFYINMSRARPGPDLSPETKGLITWIGDRTSSFNTQLMKAQVAKELIPAEIAKQLNVAIEEQKSNAHKPGTLFHELEPAKMVSFAKLPPEVIKILEPLTKQTGPVDTATIVQTIAAAYNTPQEGGAAIANYYAQNLAAINNTMNLRLAGVKPMAQYNLPIQVGMFTKARFDLTRPEEATKYLLAARMVEQQKFPSMADK